MEAINSQMARNSGVADAKSPYLFGQKLRLVEDLAAADPPIFSKPARIIELMTKLRSYAQMRSELAHATVRVVGQGNEAVFAFEIREGQPFPQGAKRFWLTTADATRIIDELKQLVKLICDQKVRSSN